VTATCPSAEPWCLCSVGCGMQTLALWNILEHQTVAMSSWPLMNGAHAPFLTRAAVGSRCHQQASRISRPMWWQALGLAGDGHPSASGSRCVSRALVAAGGWRCEAAIS
jgi:hypothetical protein